jgi:3-(3-hydroxy-phenyl)propionate hydroxylase
MASDLTCDVAVIGGGPSGLSLAALVARHGWRVVVFERHPTRYGLPRAGHVDHEVLRILQGIGAHQPLIDDEGVLEAYEWKNASGDILLHFVAETSSVSGFKKDTMMYQGVLDDALYVSLERYHSATVMFGTTVVGVQQDDTGVGLSIVDSALRPSGQPEAGVGRREIRARYVIAADGAGSKVRDEMLRIPRTDKGFNEEWLDVDLRIKRPLPPGIDGQWCDPSRPIYIGSLGARHHRFECALLPGEKAADVVKPEMAWKIMGKYGVGPEDVDIIRQVVYTFEARIATQWQSRRIFLVGDAAHTMPPHMGQGLCSGIRDASNLAWKLDLVLRGAAEDRLLETYQVERHPHVEHWIDTSIAVGLISQVLDPDIAAERDAKLLSGDVPPLPAPPSLTSGALVTDGSGSSTPPVGELFPQAPVTVGDKHGLLHDVVGHGFLLISAADDESPLNGEARAVLERIDATVLRIGDGANGTLRDETGRIVAFLAETGTVVALIRPDYYVAGAVATVQDTSAMLAKVATALQVRAKVNV